MDCECGYNHYNSQGWAQHEAWVRAERIKDQAAWEAYCELSNGIKRLADNFEVVGMMAMFGASRYAKGFSDGTLLREFCEDYVPEPYMPMGDSRPTAERLGWKKTS